MHYYANEVVGENMLPVVIGCLGQLEGLEQKERGLGQAFWGDSFLGNCWEAKEPAGWRLQMAGDAWGGNMWLEWLLQVRQGEVVRSEWSQSRK